MDRWMDEWMDGCMYVWVVYVWREKKKIHIFLCIREAK